MTTSRAPPASPLCSPRLSDIVPARCAGAFALISVKFPGPSQADRARADPARARGAPRVSLVQVLEESALTSDGVKLCLRRGVRIVPGRPRNSRLLDGLITCTINAPGGRLHEVQQPVRSSVRRLGEQHAILNACAFARPHQPVWRESTQSRTCCPARQPGKLDPHEPLRGAERHEPRRLHPRFKGTEEEVARPDERRRDDVTRERGHVQVQREQHGGGERGVEDLEERVCALAQGGGGEDKERVGEDEADEAPGVGGRGERAVEGAGERPFVDWRTGKSAGGHRRPWSRTYCSQRSERWRRRSSPARRSGGGS
jgi:hypothetical protein